MVPVEPSPERIPLRVESSMPSSASGLTEDIGVFEEAGPVRPSHLFSVAKPGLSKAAKRPPKARGIMGSVLSADGSVTREQSRML